MDVLTGTADLDEIIDRHSAPKAGAPVEPEPMRCEGCGGPSLGHGQISIRPWACSWKCYADVLGIEAER